jgi:hypothetical protein
VISGAEQLCAVQHVMGAWKKMRNFHPSGSMPLDKITSEGTGRGLTVGSVSASPLFSTRCNCFAGENTAQYTCIVMHIARTLVRRPFTCAERCAEKRVEFP